jgi:hypothetical protein
MQAPFFDIFTRYARYARIMDLDPPETLTFEEFYKFCLDMNFFKEMQELGYITYSQDNEDVKPFKSSESRGNRHLVLALSSFLSSIYSKETAKIKTPHEHGGYFISTFTRLDASTVQCLTDGGNIITFYFDNNKP